MVDPFVEDYEQDAPVVQRQATWVNELLEALEAMSLENIRDYQDEIGIFCRCRESTKNQVTAAHCDLNITMTRYKIEENYEDVEKYRRWKKELIGVSRR